MSERMNGRELAKVGCHDCKGCYSCCAGMGDTVWLDPFDAYRLGRRLGKTFQELLNESVELHVEHGLILPNLRMVKEKKDTCVFLNEEKRCSIHESRPGLCRLFPLGREYEDGKLTYFVLDGACPMPDKTKVRISKWIGQEQFLSYEHYLICWHGLTKSLRAYLNGSAVSEEERKKVNMQFLQYFYFVPYEPETEDVNDVFSLIEKRVEQFKTIVE